VVTREELIQAGQSAAYDALPGLLQWDEAGVVARDVLEVAADLITLDDEESP
jgi:hypothetical protein